MDRESFEVEFVTPCFLAGAKESTEWRAASVRGQLRWWFRAVAGGVWKGNLDRVCREEERIFGSTDRRSALRVRALPGPEPTRTQFGSPLTAAELARLCNDASAERRLKILNNRRTEEASNPIHYLGFGPIAGGHIGRSYLPPQSKAAFELQWGPGAPAGEVRAVFDQALSAWLNLGGIGAKNRKGFGSLRCDTNRFYSGPQNRQQLQGWIRHLLEPVRGLQEAAWTHLSSGSRVFLARKELNTWQEAMTVLGAWLIGFRRRYGYPADSRQFGGVSLANRDYEWAAPKGTHSREGVPDRAGFGLPLPFRRNIDGQPRGETVIWGGESREREQDNRRASPLLLHVSRLGAFYVPVLTYLPAAFLPEGRRLKFKGPFRDLFAPTPQQLSIVATFLDDLASKGLVQEVTP